MTASLVNKPGSLDLPARDAADEADCNERARDIQHVGEHEQAAEVLELAKGLALGKAHPGDDVPDKVGDEEQRPPPANKRRRAKMAPNRGTVGGGIAFEARRVAAVPDLAHDLKRTDEVKEWDEETADGPTRRVEEFPASENREVLVRPMEPNEKSHGCPDKKQDFKQSDELLSRVVRGRLRFRDASAGRPGEEFELQKPGHHGDRGQDKGNQ